MNKRFTISIFTENSPGLLHRITTVFTRRKINLDSFTASESQAEDIYRFTIVVSMESREHVLRVVRQIDKIIGVFNAFIHEEDEVVHQEVALYKMPTKTLVNGKLEVTGDGDTENFSFTYGVEDGLGNSDTGFVTVDSVPCFVAGTMIETLRGQRPVEALEPGDLVLESEWGSVQAGLEVQLKALEQAMQRNLQQTTSDADDSVE